MPQVAGESGKAGVALAIRDRGADPGPSTPRSSPAPADQRHQGLRSDGDRRLAGSDLPPVQTPSSMDGARADHLAALTLDLQTGLKLPASDVAPQIDVEPAPGTNGDRARDPETGQRGLCAR